MPRHASVPPAQQLEDHLRAYLHDGGTEHLRACKEMINNQKIGTKLVRHPTDSSHIGIATRLGRLIGNLTIQEPEAERLRELRSTAEDSAQALNAHANSLRPSGVLALGMIPIGFTIIVGVAPLDVAPENRFWVMFVGFIFIAAGTLFKAGFDSWTQGLERRAAAWELVRDAAQRGLDQHRQQERQIHSPRIEATPTHARRQLWAAAGSAGLFSAIASIALARRIHHRQQSTPSHP